MFWEWLMKRNTGQTTFHEVRAGSNLDALVRGAITAANHFTGVLSAGLQAIALALSTPEDNSGEVQKQIDKFTQQLKTSTDELDATVKAHQPK